MAKGFTKVLGLMPWKRGLPSVQVRDQRGTRVAVRIHERCVPPIRELIASFGELNYKQKC